MWYHPLIRASHSCYGKQEVGHFGVFWHGKSRRQSQLISFLEEVSIELGNKSWKSQALASNQVVILDWFCYYSLAFWLNASHSSWHNPILDVFQLLACVQTDWPNRYPRHNKKTSVCGLVTGEMPGVPVDLSLQTISFSVFRRHVRTTVINFRFVFFWGKLWR